MLTSVISFLIGCSSLFISTPQDSIGNLNAPLPVLYAEPQHRISEQLLADILTRYHYKKIELNDKFSQKVFEKYLKMLDNNKIYFLASDIDNFSKYKNQLDDELQEGNNEAGFAMYNKYLERVDQRLEYVMLLLKDTFDFTRDEYYSYNREFSPWFSDKRDLDNFWRQRLKYEGLSLKLTGKHGVEIIQTLKKRYENYRKQLTKTKSEDAFQLYMNAFTSCIDPHSDYFSPRSADDFKVNMSQSLEGIGATLTTDGDYTKISLLVKGGPAERSKKLKAGDKITAVGQGEHGEMVDVVGWRLDEVVSLIRGKKDTYVRLQIIGVDAAPSDPQKTITIKRDKIKLEEQRAKGEIKTVKGNNKTYKIGYIDLPIFYSGTTTDVLELINGFKKEGIQGIVMDLRGNTGGSLEEAIWLTGLFIKTGPVVQIKHAAGNVDAEYDQEPTIVWDGPMTVLVNRGSASASEIFSAAIQDYKRGIIIGDRTFGKGTVQKIFDLNQFGLTTERKMGQVKITTAKFYRIKGGSTQHKGVIPDIVFPTLYDTSTFGESSEEYALVYDEVPEIEVSDVFNLESKIDKLNKLHQNRMKNSIEYKYLLDDIEYSNKLRDEKALPLSEKVARQKQTERENRERERANDRRKLKGMPLLKENEKPGESDDKLDFVLDESNLILIDLIES